MEVSGLIDIPAALTQRKEAPVPVSYEPPGPQSRYGRDGEEKNTALAGSRNPGHETRSQWL
jgi:hypothetical protein